MTQESDCQSLLPALGLGFALVFSLSFTSPGFCAQETRPAPTAATPEAHVGRGYELVKDERYRQAAEEFQAALALNPNLVRARYQLAVCWFALGQFKDAREEFERLRKETAGDSNVVYYLGRIDLTEGDVDTAIREFESIISQPPFADTAYYLGSAYLKKGDLRKAEKWLKDAARLTPRDFRVQDHLARVYQKQGCRAAAEKQYALSSQLRQGVDESSQAAVACSHELETKSLQEAHTTCHQLFDRNNPDRLTTLGLLYGQHGYYQEAVEPLQQAASLDPESSEIQHDLGLTYFRLRRYKEAREPLEKSVSLRPDFFGSNALLGATLFALGEDTLSYEALFHAHQLNPQDADTQSLLFKVSVSLAQKRFTQKNYEQCLRYLETAAELHTSDPDVHRRLAEVHSLLGQRAQAERERKEAERLSETHP